LLTILVYHFHIKEGDSQGHLPVIKNLSSARK
jgi:hypothetical protein